LQFSPHYQLQLYMSSHHIVREKQEPALLIMSFDFSSENFGQLLEWSPTVLVADYMYEHADSLGIKIDGVITANENFKVQENTRIIPTTGDILQDALKFLVAEGYPAVHIITDKFALKDHVLFADLIDLVIFTGHKKIYPVRSGFSKWQSAGEQLELLHEVKNLHISGLYYLTEQVLETEKDGFYSLTFDQPFIFIAEDI
jgi:thiamine pyrophosphokinase